MGEESRPYNTQVISGLFKEPVASGFIKSAIRDFKERAVPLTPPKANKGDVYPIYTVSARSATLKPARCGLPLTYGSKKVRKHPLPASGLPAISGFFQKACLPMTGN
jgi:hypothetical protein